MDEQEEEENRRRNANKITENQSQRLIPGRSVDDEIDRSLRGFSSVKNEKGKYDELNASGANILPEIN